MEQHVHRPLVHIPLSLDMTATDYFKHALEFAKTNYQETIDRISNTKFDQVSEAAFIEEYIWAVYVSGFRASTISNLWDRLMAAHYETMWWACYYSHDDAPHLVRENAWKRAMDVFANARKVDAVIKTADVMRNGIKTMGWRAFRDTSLSTPEQLQALPFIGKITCYHLARNIGLLQYVKPDVHLVRMARVWQYESPQRMCEHLGGEYGLQPGIVDLVLWYAASTFGTKMAPYAFIAENQMHLV